MKLSSQIKPISYLKAHAAEIVRNMGEQREALIITQNGEAKVVMQDIESYEQTQKTMALLKILALGKRQIEEGKVEPAAEVVKRLRVHRGTVDALHRFLTADAAGDLEELYDYIVLHDAPGKSEHVLARIEKILSSLSESPERGTYPKELLALEFAITRDLFQTLPRDLPSHKRQSACLADCRRTS